MTRNILRVDGSMRGAASQSRALTEILIQKLSANGPASVTTRDLAEGVPFVDEAWIGANFTPASSRTQEQRAVLARSDALLREIKEADTIVLGAPVYNFGIPAAVKAWIDMIARVGESFRYTETGPVGLLDGKTVYVVFTSGGTKAGSEVDFAWPYLKHVFGFMGITDVHLIASDQLNMEAEAAKKRALAEIENLVGA